MKCVQHGVVISLFIGLLLSCSTFYSASYSPGILRSLGFKKILSPATYKNPRNCAIAAGLLATIRFLGKEPNQNRLTIIKGIKGFKPKNIVSLPVHIVRCIDDIILGYPGAKPNQHIIIASTKAKNPFAPYGILGTTWSHLAGVGERLRALENIKKILLYFEGLLA